MHKVHAYREEEKGGDEGGQDEGNRKIWGVKERGKAGKRREKKKGREGKGRRREEEGGRISISGCTEYPVVKCFKPASSVDSENPKEAHRS